MRKFTNFLMVIWTVFMLACNQFFVYVLDGFSFVPVFAVIIVIGLGFLADVQGRVCHD